MSPTTRASEARVLAPVLYMAVELSSKRRQVMVPPAGLATRADVVAKARRCSCYEAGRDGF